MNTNQMREELKKAYPGTEWQRKVNYMPESQVIAVYNRLRSAGKLGR